MYKQAERLSAMMLFTGQRTAAFNLGGLKGESVLHSPLTVNYSENESQCNGLQSVFVDD